MRRLAQTGPQRTLSVSTFANSIGSGVYLTATVLYFTQAVQLPAPQVGLGLSLAGLGSLAAGVIVGHQADRRGPRGVYVATLLGRGAATAAFTLVEEFWLFLAVVCVSSTAQTAGLAARSPLIKAHGGEFPQRFRAFLRAVTNVGISLGALMAGWAITKGTGHAYELVILGSALSFLASGIIALVLPHLAPHPKQNGHRWTALRDRRYVVLTMLDGLMAMQFRVLTVALPLWLVTTTAPPWLVSGIMLINTAMVVAFQVPASRGVTSPTAGARAYLRAGIAFLVSCATIPLAASASPWVTTAVLVSAVVVHTIGELWHAAGGFELSFALAPDHATGQYLGVFGMGAGLADTLGPSLLIALCITWGTTGWYALGAIFATIGLLTPVALRRTAPPTPDTARP